MESFFPLYGDRATGHDSALEGGFAWFGDRRAVVARYRDERLSPVAARTLLRWLRLAEQVGVPLVLEDVPALHPHWENPLAAHQLFEALIETPVRIVVVCEVRKDLLELGDALVVPERLPVPGDDRPVYRFQSSKEKDAAIQAALAEVTATGDSVAQRRQKRLMGEPT